MSVNASLFVLCKHHGAILNVAGAQRDGTLDDRLPLVPCPGSIKTAEK